jgi:hypothetical protein
MDQSHIRTGGSLAGVPYRIDVPDPPDHALDTLVALGALDVEPMAGGLAALLPDSVPADAVTGALGVRGVNGFAGGWPGCGFRVDVERASCPDPDAADRPGRFSANAGYAPPR